MNQDLYGGKIIRINELQTYYFTNITTLTSVMNSV